MKQFKTTVLAITLFVGSLSFVNAQSKVAHINTQELVAAMPEAKQAQAELERLGKTLETDLKTLQDEMTNKAKQYEQEAGTKTDEENLKRRDEIIGMQQKIGEFQQNARGEIQKKQADLLRPIQAKALAAIEKVAAAQGYEYVMDVAGLIVAKGKDLMADVKKDLGI